MIIEILISILFFCGSLGTVVLAEKAKNGFAVIHMAFFILFTTGLHFAGLFGENDKKYELTYYILTHLAIFSYLALFMFGMLWIKATHLMPSQTHIYRMALRFGNCWLIAAFFGWLFVKIYLVMKYGASAFPVFHVLAGEYATLHFQACWETPVETYARSFAVGACVIYIIRVILEKGYWKKNWLVSVSFLMFLGLYIATHSAIVGPRRFLILLALLGLVTAAWREKKTTSHFLLFHWHVVLITGIVLLGLSAYYQVIRKNYLVPEISEKLNSTNPIMFAEGIAKFMIPVPENKRIRKTTLLREGMLDIVYQVIQRRGEGNPGTNGKLVSNAINTVVPRVVAGKSKTDLNVDTILADQMSIGPETYRFFPDMATSLITIFIADFGFIGVLIAPSVILFSIFIFLYSIRAQNLTSPLLILYFFSALINLVANVEGDLVAVLSTFRDALILMFALIPFFFIRDGILRPKLRKLANTSYQHKHHKGTGT